MAGNKEGGKKAAATYKKNTTRRQRRMYAAQGGRAKVKKGTAVTGRAAEIGALGGKARAAKYQDPNFDKSLYGQRRSLGMRGQDSTSPIVSSLSPDEYQRRLKVKKEAENAEPTST